MGWLVGVYLLLRQALPEDLGEEEKKEEEPSREPFPWRTVIILLVIVGLFYAVGDRNVALTNFAPLLNAVAIAAFLGYAMLNLAK